MVWLRGDTWWGLRLLGIGGWMTPWPDGLASREHLMGSPGARNQRLADALAGWLGLPETPDGVPGY